MATREAAVGTAAAASESEIRRHPLPAPRMAGPERDSGSLREVVVVATARTPMGRYGGQLRDVRPDDLAAVVLGEVMRRAGVDPADAADVVMGCANQAGEDNRNVARMGLLLAGFPVEVPGQTVNRLCGSGMQAVVTAAREIQTGSAEVMVGGGVESMTRAPWVMAKPEAAFPRGQQAVFDTALGWRLVNPRMAELYGTLQMGETAERVAARYEIARADQDRFAARSHERALAAQRDGRLAPEIVAVAAPQRGSEPLVLERDEGPRADSTLEKLASLRPAFQEGGTVTAGNASSLSDGAAALVLTSRVEADRRRLRPIARFLASAPAGVHPDHMGVGPVPASYRALQQAGLSPEDVDLWEINEAFAAQAVACVRLLGIDEERVNVNGGAIALGHPLGCSGARLVATLVREMERRQLRYGVAAMCIGVGQGIASVWERVE
jgi:3-oxoadipyl-CoA thiolase